MSYQIQDLIRQGQASKQMSKLLKLGLVTIFSFASATTVLADSMPTSLALESVPEPSNISDFIKNKSAAVALGKALFWEMRVGGDGQESCATCHFHAGADTRIKNQLGPAHDRVGFHSSALNDTVSLSDFPFTVHSDASDRDSSLTRDVRDVMSSAGVMSANFKKTKRKISEDVVGSTLDPIFNIGGVNVNRVEPRNTPTMINAVFNLRNFWDGRAQNIFNGVNPFGKRDTTAGIYESVNGEPQFTQITLENASLASQASGPPLSDFEMGSTGRDFPSVGKKILRMRALEDQHVASDDSVFASYRDASGKGLTKTYAQLVKKAFNSKWWKASSPVVINGKNFNLMEANFSLLFSLAIQAYESTLISDKTPFDRFSEGDDSALTDQQKQGWALFNGKAKCGHVGPYIQGYCASVT